MEVSRNPKPPILLNIRIGPLLMRNALKNTNKHFVMGLKLFNKENTFEA